jgi:ATP-dependent Clp protease ATP-binding subunit ClpC
LRAPQREVEGDSVVVRIHPPDVGLTVRDVTDMFDRFDDSARRAVIMAQEEARILDHTAIGTEHILLGVLRDEAGLGARALAAHGVMLDAARRHVDDLIGPSGARGGGTLPFTPRAKKVLELALREALKLGHNYIAADHLLLGLLREGEGSGARVLVMLGVDLARLRAEVASLLSGEDVHPAGARPAATGASPASPLLDQFGRNLTAAAREGRLDPVTGRDRETERVMLILARRTKNNPILIGEPGVGKTTVVDGLAQRIAAGEVAEPLRGKQLYTLDLAGLVAGSRYRGDFEERLTKVLREVRTRGDIILFVDEIHNLVGAGAAEGAIDAASILKPMLAKGELQTIGATTSDEYRRYFEKDKPLARRFQPIQVGEPTLAQAVEMLKGLRERYEAHHGVCITDAALVAAAQLADRYLSDRRLPDKAIDLIDEAGARLRLDRLTKRLGAGDVRDETPVVGEREVAEVLADWTGIPVRQLTEAEAARLLRMEDELHRRIVGQAEAVRAVAGAIRRTRAGLKDPRRPAGSFIFSGPSGVGKSELAKALATFLFDNEDALIQIDMSEFHDRATVSRLVGAPPGYVGYDEGGQLTERVRRRPFSVVLFDEIEKAHPDVFHTLLQVLEDGRLTDGQGRIVDFKNTVIILTTNLGTHHTAGPLGFQFGGEADAGYEERKRKVTEALREHLRPEFLNRIDDTIVFHRLGEAEMLGIVDLMVADVAARLLAQGIGLSVTDGGRALLASRGSDPALGARPLRRTVQHELADALAERILAGDIRAGQAVVADARDGGLVFHVLSDVELSDVDAIPA